MSVMRPTFRLLLASLALLAATPAFAQKKADLDKEQKIKDWGYQIRTIKGWAASPAEQGDKFTVGRWKQSLDEFEKRGNYDAVRAGSYCELLVLRIQPKVETPSGDGKEAPPPPPPTNVVSASMLKRYNAKSIEEWIEGTYEGASKRWTREPLTGSQMPGDLVEFGSGSSAVTIGIFRNLGVEWAVVYRSFEENYRKEWREVYLKSLKTFKVTENIDPDVAAATRKDVTKLEGDEKRDALHASIAANPGWYAVDTKYYVFLSNCADRQFVQKLGRDLELVREKTYVPNFKPRNSSVPLNPVRVFDKESEYYQFGGPMGSAGYFSPSTGELVLFAKFQDASKSSSMNDCRSVMFHEGFHQYIHYAVGDVSPHSWFNEGHGDFFAGITINGPKIGFRVFDWRVRFLKDHMREDKDLIPCRSLVRMPQREYYSNAGLKYSQGWALIYYLRNVSTKKEHQAVLDTYFTYLADNVSAFRAKQKEKGNDPSGESIPGIPGIRIVDFEDQEKVEKILSEAVDKAFANVDFDKLDAELRAWIEKL